MRSVDVIHENPYELFNYYRVWFESCKAEAPIIDGKKMLLLYMGKECSSPCELPRPLLGTKNIFEYELPRPDAVTLRKLSKEYYFYGAFYNRNQLNAPEEVLLRTEVKILDGKLEKIEGFHRWTYSTVRGLENMTPPLLPPSVSLYNTSVLKAYAMNLDYDRRLQTQAQVGHDQYWNMGADIGVSTDRNGIAYIALDHPQVSEHLSVPIAWLIQRFKTTDPKKIMELIEKELESTNVES